MPSTNYSLFITPKPTAIENVRTATILLILHLTASIKHVHLFTIYRHISFQDLNVSGASDAPASQVRSFAMLSLLVARNWEVWLGASSNGIMFTPSSVRTGENYSKVEMGDTHTHKDNTVIRVAYFFTFMKEIWLKNVHLQSFSFIP